MPLFLAYPTSLELLRLHRIACANSRLPVDVAPDSPLSGTSSLFRKLPLSAEHSDAAVRRALHTEHPEWGASIHEPVHLYAASQNSRWNSRIKRCAACFAELPKGSFCEIESDVWTPTPEFCFLEAARTLDRFEHLQLGMELCGCYVRDPQASPHGFRRTAPATSRSRILAFCSSSSGVRGVAQARAVASNLLDQSASPRESALALLLFMPKKLGGYELPTARLNHRLASASIDGMGDIVPDILWEEARTVVEYDGKADHGHEVNLPRDARRRNRLAAAGYKIVTVTNSQLQCVRDTDQAAWDICKHLGFRWRQPRGAYDWRERQACLRNALGLRTDRTDFDGWDLVDN